MYEFIGHRDMNSYFSMYEFISGGAMCEVPPKGGDAYDDSFYDEDDPFFFGCYIKWGFSNPSSSVRLH